MKLATQQKPTPTARFDAANKEFSEGLGRQTVTGDYLRAGKTANQDNPAVDDAVVWDNLIDSRGSISLDTGNGQLTLKAGRTYYLRADVWVEHTAAFLAQFEWYDVTNAAVVPGSVSTNRSTTASANWATLPSSTAVVAPSADTVYELRLTGSSTAGLDIKGTATGEQAEASSLEVFEVGAISVDGTGALEYMDTIEVSSPVASVAFGEGGDGVLQRALDGDVDEVYELAFYWPKPNVTLHTLEIHPNGVDVGAASNWNRHISNGTTGTGSGWAFCVLGSAGSGTGLQSNGTATVYAQTGKKRVISATTTAVASDANDVIGTEVYSSWDDDSTNITGLTIINEADNLPAGSRFVLYRRVQAPVRANSADSYERRVEAAVETGTSTTEYTTGHTAFSGSVIGLTARIEEAVTAGTVVVNLKVDGTTALTVTLDTTNTVSQRIIASVGNKPFGVDKNISVEVIATGYDNATSITSGLVVLATLVNEGLIQSTQPAYMPGHIDGLALSWVSATQVSVGDGNCRDSANTANIDLDADGATLADITVSGAGGLDTGAVANDTWYALYVIADTLQQNATTTLLSTNFTTPTMPAGYDVFRRVSAVKTAAGGPADILKFWMGSEAGRQRHVWWDLFSEHSVLSAGNSTSFAAVDCSGSAPPSARELQLFFQFNPNSGAGSLLKMRRTGATDRQMQWTAPSTLTVANSPSMVPCDASQSIDYSVGGGTDVLDLWVMGYVENL